MLWTSGDDGSSYFGGDANSSYTSQITFKQGSTTLAACQIKGTAASNGNITMSEVSGQTSGGPTISFSNNGSKLATATITKSNSETKVTGQATNLGDLGK